jgi:S1-C subfamily serine protease
MRSLIKVVLPSLLLICIMICFMPLRSDAAPAPESFAPLVKKEMPSVVNFSTKQVVKMRQQSPFGNRPQRKQVRQSLGSGFIISSDGYILTPLWNFDRKRVTI